LVGQPVVSALIDLALVMLFGLQHSVMARPWFKRRVVGRMPGVLERPSFVHMANLALFTLILFWQPIPVEVWNVDDIPVRDVLWLLFAAGWVILFLGAWSFGIQELLGVAQVRAWSAGRPYASQLKTGFLYGWMPIRCMWASSWVSGPPRA
jgi:hypothetical protein